MTKYAILILVTSMLLSCENASSLLKKECNITTAQQSVWALPIRQRAHTIHPRHYSSPQKYLLSHQAALQSILHPVTNSYLFGSQEQLQRDIHKHSSKRTHSLYYLPTATSPANPTTKKLPHLLQAIHRQYALQATAFSRPAHHAHHYPRWQPDSARRARTYYKEYQRVAKLYFYLLPR